MDDPLKFWSSEDLEELDAKFDALTEYLGVEFVFEKVSDGSDVADRSRVYVRRKYPTPNQMAAEVTKKFKKRGGKTIDL